MSAPITQIRADSLTGMTSGRRDLKIAMIDGPVQASHPQFSNSRIQQIGKNSSSLSTCTTTASPSCRHGTFIAGILAANRESQAPAICPNCTLLVRPIFCEALNLEQCPTVTTDHLAEALLEAIDAGAKIVNLSLGLANGSSSNPHRLRHVYDYARRNGVLLVGASGNQGMTSVNPLFAHPWIIPVAAANNSGHVDPNSNVGQFVANGGLLAPGIDIRSLNAGGGYRHMSGSSVAAPFVTGILALLWSIHPDARAEDLHAAIRLPHIRRNRVQPPMLNAEASLQALEKLRRTSHAYRVQDQELTLMSSNEADAEYSNLPNTETVDESAVAEPTTLQPPSMEIRNEVVTAPSNEDPAVEPNSPPPVQQESIHPQGCGCGCTGGAISAGASTFVYSIGAIKPMFPDLSTKKEFEYAVTQSPGVAETDYYQIFTENNYQYLYIAENICWVLEIEGVDTYILKPRSTTELKDMIDTLNPQHGVDNPMSIVIGIQGPDAPAGLCAGLQLPLVLVNQVYYFNFQTLINSLSSQGIDEKAVRGVLKSLEIKPNAGDTPSARALNYIAFRYSEIYAKAGQISQQGDFFLQDIRTEPAEVQGTREIIDVIFKFQERRSGEQLFYYASIDVTGLFPFLGTPLRTYVPVV